MEVRTRVCALIPIHPDRDPVEGADPRHAGTIRSAWDETLRRDSCGWSYLTSRIAGTSKNRRFARRAVSPLDRRRSPASRTRQSRECPVVSLFRWSSAGTIGHAPLPPRPRPRASGRGGRRILRPPGRPVDLDRHALGEDARVDQVKRYVRAGVWEQPRALTDYHGDDEQVHLVDEVVR